MSYTNKTLPELAKLLKKRKLGNAHLYNELNKVYGVIHLPARQDMARKEAIKLLKEDDNHRFSLIKKLATTVVAAVSFAASIATIYSIYKSIRQ